MDVSLTVTLLDPDVCGAITTACCGEAAALGDVAAELAALLDGLAGAGVVAGGAGVGVGVGAGEEGAVQLGYVPV